MKSGQQHNPAGNASMTFSGGNETVRVWGSGSEWATHDAVVSADRRLFQNRPELQSFVRPYVEGEMPGLSLQPGTLCEVTRLSSSRRRRVFIESGAASGQGVVDHDQRPALPHYRRTGARVKRKLLRR